MITRIFLGLSMVVLGLFSNSQGAVPQDKKTRIAVAPKIAYVNMQKIAQASIEFRDLSNKIQEVLEPAQKEIAELQDKFEKGKKEFQALQSSAITSQDALKRKYEEVAKMGYELDGRSQETKAYAQNEIQKAEMHLLEKVKKVSETVRRAQGWDVIERDDLILASDDSFYVTDDVITLLNKEYNDELAKKAKEKEKEPSKKPKTV